jgi:hypothetical protein
LPLVAEFGGSTLGDIRRRLVSLMAEEKARFDGPPHDAVTLGTKYLTPNPTSGASRWKGPPTSSITGLADLDTMKNLFATFRRSTGWSSPRPLSRPGRRGS